MRKPEGEWGILSQLVGSSLEADRLRAVARYRVLGTRYDEAQMAHLDSER